MDFKDFRLCMSVSYLFPLFLSCTHTHTHIYIYICVCVCVCVCVACVCVCVFKRVLYVVKCYYKSVQLAAQRLFFPADPN